MKETTRWRVGNPHRILFWKSHRDKWQAQIKEVKKGAICLWALPAASHQTRLLPRLDGRSSAVLSYFITKTTYVHSQTQIFVKFSSAEDTEIQFWKCKFFTKCRQKEMGGRCSVTRKRKCRLLPSGVSRCFLKHVKLQFTLQKRSEASLGATLE